jgi:hypothetical protein
MGITPFYPSYDLFFSRGAMTAFIRASRSDKMSVPALWNVEPIPLGSVCLPAIAMTPATAGVCLWPKRLVMVSTKVLVYSEP